MAIEEEIKEKIEGLANKETSRRGFLFSRRRLCEKKNET